MKIQKEIIWFIFPGGNIFFYDTRTIAAFPDPAQSLFSPAAEQ